MQGIVRRTGENPFLDWLFVMPPAEAGRCGMNLHGLYAQQTLYTISYKHNDNQTPNLLCNLFQCCLCPIPIEIEIDERTVKRCEAGSALLS
jgi:hypothetical protein